MSRATWTSGRLRRYDVSEADSAIDGKGVTEDPPSESYWKAVNGIRLSGMPAFKSELSDTQLWQVSLLVANANAIPDSVKKVLVPDVVISALTHEPPTRNHRVQAPFGPEGSNSADLLLAFEPRFPVALQMKMQASSLPHCESKRNRGIVKILLYNPDNGVTRNFMPHFWMFLLQALTPPGHEVLLIDGNAQPMDEAGIARFVREQNIGLVGIGAMTRMIAKAYRMADAIRAVGVPVVMGGPHVTEMADEALGRDGGPRHADAVALGEADETWPKIVEDAARGELKDIYAPVDEFGQERKPTLQSYPAIPWDKIDLDQFNLVPKIATPMLQRLGDGWGTFRIIPMESGRGCPYGCEFCTVTGFFGDSIRFRTNESVVNELLLLKARAKSEGGQIAVFFIDDNFAINIKRTKSLLRDIIAAGAQVHWVAQISANLLRDEELVDLIAASGGKWVFIGMESIDPANLASVNKGFNKPGEYAAVLERLAERNVYAITSFIFGMDNDTPGVAERTLQEIRTWPPGLPIFGLLTPLPATPLYKRLRPRGG